MNKKDVETSRRVYKKYLEARAKDAETIAKYVRAVGRNAIIRPFLSFLEWLDEYQKESDGQTNDMPIL